MTRLDELEEAADKARLEIRRAVERLSEEQENHLQAIYELSDKAQEKGDPNA